MAADDTLPLRSDPLEELRQSILEQTPILHADAQAIAQTLRDSVEFERQQHKPGGRKATQEELAAWAKSEGRLYNDPTFEQWLEAYRASHLQKGVLRLYPNKGKNRDSQPDFIGRGYVEAHNYTAMAWIEDKGVRLVLNRESGDA